MVLELDSNVTEYVCRGLVPTGTYQFHLTYALADGTRTIPGPETSVDTMTSGCIPKSDKQSKDRAKNKNSCSIQ